MCCYHFPCLDGFTAAWAVWKKYGDALRYVPCNYDKSPPDVRGEHVLIVDFSFKAPVLEQMLQDAASITILDHHKTAEADLAPFLQDGRVHGKFDMDHSGASLAWQHCHPDVSRPYMIMFVEDYDLWRLESEFTRAIKAAMTSYDYDMQTWSKLAQDIENPRWRNVVIQQGQAIDRAQLKSIREVVENGISFIKLGGHTVPCCNLPYMWASDGAGLMATQHDKAPFAAAYYDQAALRVFSLRSRGKNPFDVSQVAKQYGGGGHVGAAGFQAPLGWLGDA